MNSRNAFNSCLVAVAMFLGANHTTHNAEAVQPNQADSEAGVQVLTRGPVHEAFAETVTFDPEPGIVVPKLPPEAIEEVPPEQRPEGDNVTWIPGYSAWDEEREDFLWVSGIWRDLPPGRQWMPGYWTESGSGAQWISGYWADAALTEIQYLPEPPATVEVGPNIAAPSHDHNWLPGCWIWQQNRYAWRPGYWAPMQPDWDWVPAHYVWCPRGYVFVDGYHDYSVARRGVLFAPVYLDAGIYSQRGYSYSPSTVIDLGLFTAHLFSRPRYNHYYFGDYYESNYTDAGYYPWFSYGASGHGYDPFYARQRWDHRQDNNWQRRIETDFANRRDHEDARPPRTLAAMIELNENAAKSSDKSLVVAMSLEDLAKSSDSPQRFQATDKEERQALAQRRQDMQTFRKERQQLEAEAAVTRGNDPFVPTEPVNVKLPTSPIVSTPAETPGKHVALPKTQDAPKVDLKVEPKARVARESRQNARDAKASQRIPGVDTTPPTSNDTPKDTPKAEPKSDKKGEPAKERPKGEPKSKRGKADPMPDEPKVDPKSDEPKADSKPGKKGEPKSDRPKGEPKSKRGKADPMPDAPKVDPKSDVPKVDSKPGQQGEPKPDRPKDEPKSKRGKADPNPDVPKANPKPDSPKVDPKTDKKGETRPDRPKGEPKSKRGKADPKPEVPKVDPKPDVPEVQPKPNIPKAEPKPDVPKVDPKPEVPKVDPTKPPKP